MEIHYAKATKEDLSAIATLCALLYADDETKTENEIKEEVLAAINNNLLWAAKAENEVVGFGLVELFVEGHKNFPNSIFLYGLYVVESCRRLGIGGQLLRLALAEQYPPQFKYFSVTHDPNKLQLSSFYEKFGFKQDGFTKAGNVRMVKEVQKSKF
jgi:ribosomal protein S18 acetylase RimI-like enzyme